MASSGPNDSSPPIPSEALRGDPTTRAYLIRVAGQDMIVTLAEARQYFELGYAIRDPDSRELVDIGSVAIPSYTEEEGAFVAQEEEEKKAREALKESVKKSEQGGSDANSVGHSKLNLVGCGDEQCLDDHRGTDSGETR